MGAAGTLKDLHIAPSTAFGRADYERLGGALRAAVSEEAFTMAWEAGRAMTLDQAIAATVRIPTPEQPSESSGPNGELPAPAAEASPSFPGGLTIRELEVLRLLAAGHTYAQMAEELVISYHTVNQHLQSIYGKLGVNTRHAATRWAIDHNLL
jgi:DNA-binding CsgD family transcriptional regulator